MEISLALTLAIYHALCMLSWLALALVMALFARPDRHADWHWQRRRLRKVCLSGRIEYKHSTAKRAAGRAGAGKYMSGGSKARLLKCLGVKWSCARLALLLPLLMKTMAAMEPGQKSDLVALRLAAPTALSSYPSAACICVWKLFSIFVIWQMVTLPLWQNPGHQTGL